MSNMSSSLTSGLKKAFFAVIALLSASTTFLYFMTTFGFGREMIGDELLTQILTGAWGVIVLDLAAIIWLRIYLNGSDNNALRSIAVVGMVIGLAGSALTSFAYIVSSSNNVTLPPTLAEGSVWALAAITVAHFILAFLSGYKSTSAQIDERTAGMLSEATDEMLVLTEQMFRDSIPALARQNAAQLQQLLAGRFASLTAFGETQARPPAQLSAPRTATGEEAQRMAATAEDLLGQPRRTRSLSQLLAMLARVDTEDALHDYDTGTHRDVNALSSSDYEEWFKARSERAQLLADYGRLDEHGAPGGTEAGKEHARRVTTFTTSYTDENGSVPVSLEGWTADEWNALVHLASQAKQAGKLNEFVHGSSNRPTNGSGSH